MPNRRSPWLAGCVGLIAVAVLGACSSTSTAGNMPAATYHSDNGRTGFSTSVSINPGNVHALTQKWSVSGTATISAQAIVAGGSVYWGDWNGYEHATSTSGKALWSTFVGRAPKPPGCPFSLGDLGVTSTATVGVRDGENTVWVGGGGGSLYALDASSGAVLWRTKLGAPPENVLWSSPALYNGSIYEGVASWNDCPAVVYGKVFRVNAATGDIQGVFSPEKRYCVGGGIWSSPAIDGGANALFVTSGNDNCNSSVQNSIFKLDATTMAIQSYWQAPANSLVSDADFGATPTLFSATINGTNRQLVGGESKSGVYYALDRNNLAAGPVWTHVVEDDATLSSVPCQDKNTISSSAWAGPGTPLMVAGLAVSGSSCIGTLAALDPATGNAEWQVPLQGPVEGAVTEAPGLVAVGASTFLDVLSSSKGAMLFSYAELRTGHDTGNGYDQPYWFWAPPTFAGSSLYIGNQDGRLRAFGL
jgi:polyvinyl alcohol dehydrogenase (cytochrome)